MYALLYITLYVHLGNQVLRIKSKQSTDMIISCSIMDDFLCPEAELCEIRPFSAYPCMPCMDCALGSSRRGLFLVFFIENVVFNFSSCLHLPTGAFSRGNSVLFFGPVCIFPQGPTFVEKMSFSIVCPVCILPF